MNVIFLRSNPVSPDSRVEKEVNVLIKAGWGVHIFAWDRNENYSPHETEFVLPNGKCTITRVGIRASYGGGIKKNLRALLKFQFEIYKQLTILQKKYDVIHACDFDTAFAAFIFSKKHNKKLVYDIFDFYTDAFNVPVTLSPLIKKLDFAIINASVATIICSEKRKQQIKGTNPAKLVILHNTPPFYNGPAMQIASNKIKIVYVGILASGRFLKELTEFVFKNNNYELHIGGFGPLEMFVKEAASLASNIKFYGKLTYDQTLSLEKAADILTAIYDPTIPNHYYAAPNKFYEALMLGKPLIMAANTGLDDIIIENNLGAVFNYTAEDFEKQINNLVNHQSEWPEISRRMKSLYNENFSWIIMEKRLVDLYSTLEEINTNAT